MASKIEVVNFIKSNYKYEETGNELKLIFNVDGGRTQLVFAVVNDFHVEFASPFASVDAVTAKQALDAGSNYPLGIGIVGSFYAVKHIAPIADLDPSEIAEGFDYVTKIADMLEQKLVGGDNL